MSKPEFIDSSILALIKYKGDLAGGITSAFIIFPQAIAFGALVFSPLGPEYIPVGIIAGLISLFIANVISGIFGSSSIVVNAPFSLSSFMLLTVFSIIVDQLDVKTNEDMVTEAIALLFVIVFISGIFQSILGFLKIGSLAKYIPYPVLAGLLNGSAILIILSQLTQILGLPSSVKILDLGTYISQIQVLTLIVGMATCLVIIVTSKMKTRMPAPILGILAGTILYHMLEISGFDDLGSVIGAIPSTDFTPEYVLQLPIVLSSDRYWQLIISLIPYALGIAVLNSLRSLIIYSSSDNLLLTRSNNNKELIAQGYSNMTSAIFGGLSTCGSLKAMLANYQYGGRRNLSLIISGIFSLLILLYLSPFMANIPHAVVAGLLIIMAFKSFDSWSLGLFNHLNVSWETGNRNIFVNVISVITVTLFVVIFGILQGLAIGLIISISWFVIRMGKSGVRREFKADKFHSNTQRGEKEFLLLEQEGKCIQVLELEGALFFGTADKIAAQVDKYLKQSISCVILDMNRITEIDTTGANIIKQLYEKCYKSNVDLFLSSITPNKPQVYQELSHFFTADKMLTNSFIDLEAAMSKAEDNLLNAILGGDRYNKEMSLEKIDAFEFLESSEVKLIEQYLIKKSYTDQEPIFHQGDSGDGVYFVVKGRADIVQSQWDDNNHRIGTLCPGTTIGEMALIDHRPRSAEVIADGSLVSFYLSSASMEQLSQEKPLLANKIIRGLAKVLSTRLRIANRIRASIKI